MGKALLVLLIALWAVPFNTVEVLSIGDSDTSYCHRRQSARAKLG